jgi:hypothetical protein
MHLSYIPYKPTYTLHPSFPVWHVLWCPDYRCKLVIVLNDDFHTGSSSSGEINAAAGASPAVVGNKGEVVLGNGQGDAVEIWDVRKGWIAKWAVGGSAVEGGIAGMFSLLPLNELQTLFLLTHTRSGLSICQEHFLSSTFNNPISQ